MQKMELVNVLNKDASSQFQNRCNQQGVSSKMLALFGVSRIWAHLGRESNVDEWYNVQFYYIDMKGNTRVLIEQMFVKKYGKCDDILMSPLLTNYAQQNWGSTNSLDVGVWWWYSITTATPLKVLALQQLLLWLLYNDNDR